MSDSKEYITSDEEEEIYSSDSSANLPSGSLTIEESEDDAEESIIGRKHRKARKRVAIVKSDSENTDDDEVDRALSPRTRLSITGIRPSDLNDDSSEIEYSDKENGAPKAGVSSVQDEESETSTEEESDEGNTENKNSFVETSAADGTNNSAERSSSSDKYDSAEENAEVSEDKTAGNKVKPALDSPFSAPRYSTHFKSNISETLSSTVYQAEDARIAQKKNSSESDLEIISVHEPTIEISSSSEDSENKRNQSQEKSPNEISRKKDLNLLQPKILPALAATKSTGSGKPKTPRKSMHIKYVSQEFYDKEVKKLLEIKSELHSAERLLEKISKSLPDGGRQLSLRIERLQTDIQIKTKYLDTLRIDDSAHVAQQHQQKPLLKNEIPDWNELSKAVNQIQPTHTGKQGMATFNTQKVLTVDRLKDLHGSLESRPAENVLADDPEGLKVSLMAHQKHALAWMSWREKQKPRGGILADDMGLGKTLTMISLVLASKNEQENHESESEDEDENKQEQNKGWSSKGRKDFYSGGTLVICPASLVRQWECEVQSKLSRHKLTVCVHHGNNRDTKPKHLRTYDMVVTTYNIAAREHKTQGALFGMKWRRIILDEAHVIRNHKAQSSEAVCVLRGKYRWALTGTPIQNKEMDVYALLKFLRCTPFDDLAHWKRWIDKSAGGQQRLNTVMKTLMLRRTKTQLQELGELQCLPDKRVNLIEVILDKDEMNVYQKIMAYSRTLFAQFLFQRAERNTDLMYSVEANRPTFMQTKDPNGAYYKIHEKFAKLHHGGKEIKSHEILVLLLRLRQICCHPGLIDAMLEDEDAQHIEQDSDEDEQEIDLLAQLNKLAITDTSTGSNSSGGISEALAPEEEVIAKASAKVLQRSNPVFDLKRPSSKMLKVLETLQRCILCSSDKAIVVSQWTSVLNILKTHLENAGICTLSLNGSIAVKNRQEVVTQFNNERSRYKVLLLSLTAGGVGLNLVGANHLLMIDLHWNPQLEAQAQDRIYRVGQKKNVVIYKFMCKDTVEQRIKALQEHKMAIANCVLTGAKTAEGSKLTMDDLKSLFGM